MAAFSVLLEGGGVRFGRGNGMNPGYCVLVTVWLAELASVILSPFTKVATITVKRFPSNLAD